MEHKIKMNSIMVARFFFSGDPNRRIEARPSDHEVASFDGRQPRSQSRANIHKRFITIGNLCRLLLGVGKKIYFYISGDMWRIWYYYQKDLGDSTGQVKAVGCKLF